MTVTLLGPRWTGERLRLKRPAELGLRHTDIVGWSDFYGGGPCQVNVAAAASGGESGYLVWGGTLGLRVVPGDVEEVDKRMGESLVARSLLWIRDASLLPVTVRQVVEVGPARPIADRAPPESLEAVGAGA